jgi:hypothetical protein
VIEIMKKWIENSVLIEVEITNEHRKRKKIVKPGQMVALEPTTSL